MSGPWGERQAVFITGEAGIGKTTLVDAWLGGVTREVVAQRVPTWPLHMPWLLNTARAEAVPRQVLGATRERMLRELAEASARAGQLEVRLEAVAEALALVATSGVRLWEAAGRAEPKSAAAMPSQTGKGGKACAALAA